ncbi:uncharacterized protein LOC120080986 [Benincasa hispida]|uniref:uncharacterized protein LOC120080986 n=1 Tax=Benincasa hispida TaxID=102211 RepID=UPI001902B363|nr:uncharacterized protein LOC120080986 [Benincasa hispida]
MINNLERMQEINLAKSELLGIHVLDSEFDWLVNSFGFKRDYEPFTYLGLPLGGNPNHVTFWQLVMERIQHKLHNWKWFPLVISCLDKLVQDFFWEDSHDDVGIHNVNWEISQRPQLLGGLGIGNFKHRNSTLGLGRFFSEHDALGRSFIVAKYYSIDCIWPTPISHTSFKAPWRFICQNIGLMASRIRHTLGDGPSTSSWYDSWLNCGILSAMFPRLYRLAQQPEASMAILWNSSSHAWDLNLRHNLTELEIAEWTTLSHYLLSVRLCSSLDS